MKFIQIGHDAWMNIDKITAISQMTTSYMYDHTRTMVRIEGDNVAWETSIKPAVILEVINNFEKYETSPGQISFEALQAICPGEEVVP